MTPDEIETALQAAFNSCDAASCPLTDQQKQILLRVIEQIQGNSNSRISDIVNPLDELTPEELEAFLQFVKIEEQQNRTWKVQLLNDWLHNNDSGEVQFIRQSYGLQWLNRVESCHFDKYSYYEDALKLRVGDRIEVSNAMWEWVQDDGLVSVNGFPAWCCKWMKFTMAMVFLLIASSASTTALSTKFKASTNGIATIGVGLKSKGKMIFKAITMQLAKVTRN